MFVLPGTKQVDLVDKPHFRRTYQLGSTPIISVGSSHDPIMQKAISHIRKAKLRRVGSNQMLGLQFQVTTL